MGEQRAKRLLRDLADQPFVALVMPTEGDTKIYVKGVDPEKMIRIQKAVENILNGRPHANPDEPGFTIERD